MAGDWSPDGKFLVFSYLSQPRLGEHPAFDIGVVMADGRGQWKPLLQSEAAEVNPDIAPSGTGSPTVRIKRDSSRSTSSDS